MVFSKMVGLCEFIYDLHGFNKPESIRVSSSTQTKGTRNIWGSFDLNSIPWNEPTTVVARLKLNSRDN